MEIQASTSQFQAMDSLVLHLGTPLTLAWPQRLSLVAPGL